MKAPEYNGNLRSNIIKVPEVAETASGIRVFGRLIKSLFLLLTLRLFVTAMPMPLSPYIHLHHNQLSHTLLSKQRISQSLPVLAALQRVVLVF